MYQSHHVYYEANSVLVLTIRHRYGSMIVALAILVSASVLLQLNKECEKHG